MLQEGVNNVLGPRIAVDGAIGPKSVEAINLCDPDLLYKELYKLAKERYERLAQRGNNQKFLKGWMNRLNDPIHPPEDEPEPSQANWVMGDQATHHSVSITNGEFEVWVPGASEEDARKRAEGVLAKLNS